MDRMCKAIEHIEMAREKIVGLSFFDEPETLAKAVYELAKAIEILAPDALSLEKRGGHLCPDEMKECRRLANEALVIIQTAINTK